MRRRLLESIRCPSCRSQLCLEKFKENEREILEGNLICNRCYLNYKIDDGIPILLRKDIEGDKRNEIIGWDRWKLQMHQDEKNKSKKIKDEPINTNDNQKGLQDFINLPYIEGEYWRKAKSCLNLSLKRLYLDSTKRILEIGAGCGWLSRYYQEKGAYCIASDLRKEDLLQAHTYTAILGCYFEKIVADAECLPFEENSIDIVVGCATLHHFSDMERLLIELSRVLTSNGEVYFMNEPLRPITKNEEACLADNLEKKLGINEHIYSYFQYKRAFLKTGFKSSLFLEEFDDHGDSFANFKDYISQISLPFIRLRLDYILKNAIGKRVIEIGWMLFGGGCLNIHAKKHS